MCASIRFSIERHVTMQVRDKVWIEVLDPEKGTHGVNISPTQPSYSEN